MRPQPGHHRAPRDWRARHQAFAPDGVSDELGSRGVRWGICQFQATLNRRVSRVVGIRALTGKRLMQCPHRSPGPIAVAGAWLLRKALKQLATLGGRKRKPADVSRAGLQLV